MHIIEAARMHSQRNRIVSWAENNISLGASPIELTDKQKNVLKDHAEKERHYMIERCGGKTTLLLIEALYDAIHHPNTTALVFGVSTMQSRLIKTKALDLLDTVPNRSEIVSRIGTRMVEFTNGSKIYFMEYKSINGEGLRGISLHNRRRAIFGDNADLLTKTNLLTYARAVDAKLVTYGSENDIPIIPIIE